jgi:Cytochrome bd terminal oxidase subunit II
MVMFWVSLLAVSILLYVLLDGIDLGVGLLFGLATGEARRGAMLSAVAPIWDGNETWLVVTAVILVGSFSSRLCHVAVGILSPSHYYAARPDLARRGVRVSLQDPTASVDLGSELCRRVPNRDFHSGDDSRRPGGRAANHERRIFRRGGRLTHAVCLTPNRFSNSVTLTMPRR